MIGRLAARLQGSSGSATVEFALVAPLLLAVALAVVQLALTLHVRTTVTSAAAEGARAAALAGADLSAGERRVRSLLAHSIAGDVIDDITVRRDLRGGLVVVSVGVDARLPLIGLLGPTVMHVDGHALAEWT